MSCEAFLVGTVHLLCNFDEVIILIAESLHLLECCFSDLSVFFKLLRTVHGLTRQGLTLGILLCLSSLCQKHLPFANIIHGLVLMRHQVTLDKWTVLHQDTFPVSLFFCSCFALVFVQVNQGGVRILQLTLSPTT